MAHRAGRVIDTDTLRISLVVQVSSDGQEREQDSDDNPNVNVHESRPAAAIPLSNLASRQYTRNIFNGLMSGLIANQWVRAVFRFASHSPTYTGTGTVRLCGLCRLVREMSQGTRPHCAATLLPRAR
jgi:hypothetical protein